MSPDIASYFLLCAAVFAVAFVSGLAGFAFSAVAGGIILHMLEPLEAVPLMMACSVGYARMARRFVSASPAG